MGNSQDNKPAEGQEPAADMSQLKRALVAIKDLRTRLDASERTRFEPIAIVGIGCRFPGGVETPAQFWNMLVDGVDAVGPVPPSRWDSQKYYDPDPDAPGKTAMHSGGFLTHPVDRFDAPFFNIAPREAIRLDPQQRLLLEVSWEALEDAGIAPSSLGGSEAGVYFGLSTSDYKELELRNEDLTEIDPYLGTGGAACVAAGRVSYFLGLHGPAMAVDTACSSSLVAIDLAVQALRAGRCPVALAGGVNLMLVPEAAIYLSKVRALSADGRCKAFDAAADGYGRGEGCGVVVLKRLSDAVANGDRVIAVIRGSAVNHDGRSSGLTVPNGAAQRTVIEQALSNGRLEPADVAYVEAHGTGTPLGDPIELRALGGVLGRNRAADNPLLVGTAKTNLGHLEAAAGIAGLIKVALSLSHGFVPRNLHFNTPSPHIPWQELPIAVPVEGQPWPQNARKIAGVSSFGFSGTNAHVILEGGPDVTAASAAAAERAIHILPLSARSADALEAVARRHVSLPAEAPAADVCFTAATGRAHFAERLAVSGRTTAELKAALQSFLDGAATGKRGSAAPRATRVAFLFTGQGSQYVGMGKALYDTEPVFRAALDECQRLLASELDMPLLDVVHGRADDPAAVARLTQTQYTQPALFAIEYALVQLWKSWGIEPAAVLGHSVGEYAAACVAGVLSLPDALRLVATRGRLMQSLPAGGRMAAIFETEARVTAALAPYGGRVSIAAINGPEHVVVSGAGADVDRLIEQMRGEGTRAEALAVSHAFHSALMDPILDEFERVASTLQFSKPRVKFVSNLTGAVASDAVTTPRYWRDHLRQSVKFADGVRALSALSLDLFVEVGPHPVLSSLVAGCLPAGAATCLPSLRRNRDDWQQIADTTAELYVRGAAIDWTGFHGDRPHRPLSLPTYPFERERYWIEASRPAAAPRAAAVPGCLAGHRLRSPLSSDVVFQAELNTDTAPFVADHVIYGNVIFPAAGLIELALSAAAAGFPGGRASVERFSIQEPLALADGQSRTVQTVLAQPQERVSRFTIYSTPSVDETAPWVTHATGELRLDAALDVATAPSLEDVRARCTAPTPGVEFYASLSAAGIEFGPTFRGIEEVWNGEREAVGRITPDAAGTEGGFVVHPALLDTSFQLLGAAFAAADASQSGDVFLPIGIDRVQLLASPGASPFWGYAALRESDSANTETITADLWWLDDRGAPLLRVDGFTAKRASRAAMERAGRRAADRLLHEVDWVPLEPVTDSDAPIPTWIVLGERAGVAADLAAALRTDGAAATLVVHGADRDGALDAHTYGLHSESRTSFEEMLRRLLGDNERCGVVDARAVDAAGLGAHDGCRRLHGIIQALTTHGASGVRLWVVTKGAQPAEPGEVVDPAQSAVSGLARVIAAEHAELACAQIDLDPAAPVSIDLLAHEIRAGRDENQVALRADRRFGARLVPHGAAALRTQLPRPASECWRLVIPQRGTIDNLQFEPADRRRPGPGEIEVRVHSTGLNFRDVLNVLGMYPGDPGPLGSECAGVVTAIGDGVTTFKTGDEVMCMGGGSFRPYFTVSAGLVLPKPSSLSFEAASGVPIAFLTALYGLSHLAGMKRGDRVLIHAAAGGVGLAAVQIALRAGAEVFGTAGSPSKRQLLRDLGVQHVMSSRTLEFADEIATITGGRGVDIVLNSLAGDFITRSMSLLSPGGRFIEIGKADIWDNERVARVNATARYFAFDLGEVVLRDSELAERLYAELLAGLAEGTLRPLPVRTFSIGHVAAAFRFMAQARHVGKIVVSQPAARRGATGSDAVFRADGAYLVTGGLGALGLSVADWMVQRGARHLVLAGRSAPSAATRDEIAALEARGATVKVVSADVATEIGVTQLIAAATANGRSLRGVIHAAGVLSDGVVADQPWDAFERVLAPKVTGTELLDRLTRDHALEHFILFSSVASVMGSQGQGLYAAANAFMDAVAQRRRGLGLPAQSINWGPWGERGMAASLTARERERLGATGFEMMPTADALAALDRSLDLNPPQVMIVPARWDVVCGRFADGQVPPLLRSLGKARQESSGSVKTVTALKPRLDAVPDSEKYGVVVAFVREQVMKALGLSASGSISLRTPFTDLGLDSLMAVELRNGLAAATGLELRASLIYDHPCIDELAAHISAGMLCSQTPASAAEGDEGRPAWAAIADDLENLSESELAGLLSAGMASLRLEDQ